MENSKKIHFITYSNNVFDNAKKRLLNQANRFYPFTSISGYGPNDLPLDFEFYIFTQRSKISRKPK